jgi:hypothetical protein
MQKLISQFTISELVQEIIKKGRADYAEFLLEKWNTVEIEGNAVKVKILTNSY